MVTPLEDIFQEEIEKSNQVFGSELKTPKGLVNPSRNGNASHNLDSDEFRYIVSSLSRPKSILKNSGQNSFINTPNGDNLSQFITKNFSKAGK